MTTMRGPHHFVVAYGVLVDIVVAAAAAAAVTSHTPSTTVSTTAATAEVTVNTTSVVSGDSVLVSWKDALRTLRPDVPLAELNDHPLYTEWLDVAPSGATAARTKPDGYAASAATASPLVMRVFAGPGTSSVRVVGGGDNSTFWLGQFSPAVTSLAGVTMTGDPTKHGQATEGTPPFTTPAPAKFISGTQLAAGEWAFIVTNSRQSVNWVLFEGSLTDATNFRPLALSPAVHFADAAHPAQLRLARTSSTDEMRVSWTATVASVAAGATTVQWGLAADALNRTANATAVSSYLAADLCGAPANNSGFHDPGLFFSAVLDLSGEPAAARLAGLDYFYRVGGDQVASVGWSPVYSFRAPKPAYPHASLSVLVAADMGETYEDGSQYHWEEPAAVNTTAGMAYFFAAPGNNRGSGSNSGSRVGSGSGNGGMDLVLHPGDLAYATGYESEWDRFMEQIQPIAARAPYMTGQGNHERDFPLSGNTIGSGDSGGECGVPTQSRFRMPVCLQPNTAPCIGTRAGPVSGTAADPTAVQPRGAAGPIGSPNDGWYSFEQGPVHFLHLNTEMNSTVASRQHAFVAADLAAVDRLATPWVVVLGHRQMYSGNCMEPQNDLGDLEPLLLQFKVDLAMWGHIHFAQQSCPMCVGWRRCLLLPPTSLFLCCCCC